jgi:hypothetical protein
MTALASISMTAGVFGQRADRNDGHSRENLTERSPSNSTDSRTITDVV